ncbi:MAG: hypothetical protein KAH44_05580, partial [Oricola sp.]|nr:hypothetical protein [Oricola sp.]
GLAYAPYFKGEYDRFVMMAEELKVIDTDNRRKTPEEIAALDAAKKAIRDQVPGRWQKLIAEQPEETKKAFADYQIEYFRNEGYIWAEQVEQVAKDHGVHVVGMYEAGNHLNKTPAYVDKAWRDAFIWGEEGGRANYEIYLMMAKRFPGIVIANYTLAGPVGGDPWGDGMLGEDNPYAASYRKLMETVRK